MQIKQGNVILGGFPQEYSRAMENSIGRFGQIHRENTIGLANK